MLRTPTLDLFKLLKDVQLATLKNNFVKNTLVRKLFIICYTYCYLHNPILLKAAMLQELSTDQNTSDRLRAKR